MKNAGNNFFTASNFVIAHPQTYSTKLPGRAAIIAISHDFTKHGSIKATLSLHKLASFVVIHIKTKLSQLSHKKPVSLQGLIPLHIAAENGHIEAVSLLISKSADQLYAKDKLGRTALHLAAVNAHKEIVTLLVSQGSDTNAQDNVRIPLKAKIGCPTSMPFL